MPQHSEKRDLTQSYRPDPTLAEATTSTVPAIVQPPQHALTFQLLKRHFAGLRAVFLLLVLGGLLELLYLALYPLLAGIPIANDPVQQALPGIFPWLSRLYWTTMFPTLRQFLTQVPWLNLTNTGEGAANLLLLLLCLAFALSLLAARIGRQIVSARLSILDGHALFWTTIIVTALFGLTMLCAPSGPGIIAQDMLTSGLYGRVVVVHHANPYIVTSAVFSLDVLHQALLKSPGVQGASSYGPVWMDLSILVTLFARDSVANILLGFRLIGLVAHLLNAILLWSILARVKPETRISATLLYAWNPVVLLLSVFTLHQEVVVILLLLTAILFFQRNTPMLGWVFVLLATLISLFCLLLLPLFLRVIMRKTRIMRLEQRSLWWPGLVVVTLLVIALAYAPYWQGWGFIGLRASIFQIFWPDRTINTLDAALLNLPVGLPASVLWLFDPHHWALCTLVIIGCFLLFAIWLVDSLELALLCASWLFILLVILMPIYWPWYVMLPLVLALCSANRNTIFLTILLTVGALLSYYLWLLQPVWSGQALLTVELPLLLWGWALFLTSAWHVTRAADVVPPKKSRRSLPHFSRPSWLSRPSWPSRPDLS
ncbi:MAG: hypothetical protein JOZ18_02425 [Chloroflexi bacterium]|nr:hypothetical protein [Chloroflexota bacterium]